LSKWLFIEVVVVLKCYFLKVLLFEIATFYKKIMGHLNNAYYMSGSLSISVKKSHRTLMLGGFFIL